MKNWVFIGLVYVLSAAFAADDARAQDRDPDMDCKALHDAPAISGYGLKRTVCADVVALDQTLVYNRFGSFNPFGMMFALRRDVVPLDTKPEKYTAEMCDADLGTVWNDRALTAGQVRLRDCKRPRPIVLRANVGDLLTIRLGNLLFTGSDANSVRPPDYSADFCPNRTDPRFGGVGGAISTGPQDLVDHGEASCVDPVTSASSADLASPPDWPATRGVNFAIQGLRAVDPAGGKVDARCLGEVAIPPNASITCHYAVLREGPYFVASTAAPAGGEGDGGSLTHGLFGAINVQKDGTRWYRSQVSQAAMKLARATAPAGQAVDYDARDCGSGNGDCATARFGGVPVLDMLAPVDGGAYQIVHSDLNAIVDNSEAVLHPERRDADGKFVEAETGPRAFRELSVFFHDELKSFYTRNFEELGAFGSAQLAGARDGFAINYGASGMGSTLLANRKGIGPSANCTECLYEEFFLTSWANGDPALLETYSDDPSNVHHSYLNDAVVFRNYHAGPKETHVFHLHAHQWYAGNDNNRGSFLDSQTVGPQQSFSYDITGGGLEVYHRGIDGGEGWWETLGSGNRNRTVGDSIFHCHLYPHFAQGMWELWRVHDVFEDGSRKLPDGQWNPGLSLTEEIEQLKALARPGSVHRQTGQRIEPGDGLDGTRLGTPIPALVPLPHQAVPPVPSYPDKIATLQQDGTVGDVVAAAEVTTFPGYPFYVPGTPGHRPPQAPMDIARERAGGPNGTGQTLTAEYLDGGLPRHIVRDGSSRAPEFAVPKDLPPLGRDREIAQSQIVAKALALGDMTMKFKSAVIEPLPYDGTPLERAAMAFHHDGQVAGQPLRINTLGGASASYNAAIGAYDLDGQAFAVNGAPPKPGAPYADPCGAPDKLGRILRIDQGGAITYRVLDENGDAHDLMATPAGTTPMGTGGTPAVDQDVSNWANRRLPQTLTEALPVLYYVADGTVHQLDRRGALPRDAASPLLLREADPFLDTGAGGPDFTSDPGVIGFRRYEASAVQLDLVTNRAGWHDPQARINVLTAASDSYKDGPAKPANRFSPKVSASEAPFFFRALSGECIEFRHTNELPKDLELDDFQVRTPTDTIGQHIHLVKFDVTASDGSANGWNYEDGTFAPDEIAARICAARNIAGQDAIITASRAPGELKLREAAGLCEQKDGLWVPAVKDIWRLPLSQNRHLFQTTTQRWFADPILSELRHPRDDRIASADPSVEDRTLRTVFSHDHFGPSSIQQHGFYTALVLEKQGARICTVAADLPGASASASRLDYAAQNCTPVRRDRALLAATAADVGPRKVILLWGRDSKGAEKDLLTREYALAVADFATLYDPRDRTTAAELIASTASPSLMQGMASLVCEARNAGDPAALNARCGSGMETDGTGWHGPDGQVPPSWLAFGRPGDATAHQLVYRGNWTVPDDPALGTTRTEPVISPAEIAKLQGHMLTWRANAAGYATSRGRVFAKPVAPPQRPESISVDHHDPYLLNYRGEPLPLRVGGGSGSCVLRPLSYWVAGLQSGGITPTCSVVSQTRDMSLAFRTGTGSAGQPVTPILESRDGERVAVRLIQGAQEVQHSFTLEDRMLQRNIDQAFPSGMLALDDITPPDTLVKECEIARLGGVATAFAHLGRPDEYARWFVTQTGALPPAIQPYWAAYDQRVARCFNAEGRIATQEIGISEHFEFAAAYRHDTNFQAPIQLYRRHQELPDFDLDDLDRLDPDTPAPVIPDLQPMSRNLDRLQRAMPQTGLRQAVIDDLRRVPGDTALSERGRRQVEIVTDRVIRQPETALDLIARPPFLEAFPDLFTPRPKLASSDSLIHFGSQDAMWNGAWGLLRVFESDQPKPTPVALCDPKAPRLQAVIAAVSVRRLDARAQQTGGSFPRATDYAPGLTDRDGLFFALIDPNQIRERLPSGLAPMDPADPRDWPDLPVDAVLDAVLSAYDRPEPLVLNVNAGSCLRLVTINALEGQRNDSMARLEDEPGDAHMPPITPLNVDLDWPVMAEPLSPENVWAAHQATVAPSSALALNLPLPVAGLLSRLPRPVGGSDTSAAMPASSNGWLRMGDHLDPGQIQVLEMYAGMAVLPDRATADVELQLSAAQTRALTDVYATEVNRALTDNGLPEAVRAIDPTQLVRGGDLLDSVAPDGFQTRIDRLAPSQSQALRSRIDAAQLTLVSGITDALADARRQQAAEARYIPYAFGAVPLRSMSDVIGHVTHGLFGAITVIPQDAKISDDLRRSSATAPCDIVLSGSSTQTCPLTLILPSGNSFPSFGASVMDLPELSGAGLALPDGSGGKDHRIRQFTIFWQDGLNLRDAATRDQHRTSRLAPIIAQRPDLLLPVSPVLPDPPVTPPLVTQPVRPLPVPPRPIDPRLLVVPGRITDPVATPQITAPQITAPQITAPQITRPLIATPGRAVTVPQDLLRELDPVELTEMRKIPAIRLSDWFLRWNWRLVANCLVCTDSYDWGEKGVSYRAAPFNIRLRSEPSGVANPPESHYDLNAYDYGSDFWRLRPDELAQPTMPVLRAVAGEQVVIHVVHPGGRARQRAFVTIGQDYDDLFPGFGFPRGALLAPGKSLTASLTMPVTEGCYLWFDGPTTTRSGGAWGLLEVVGSEADLAGPQRGRPCARD